MISEDFAGLTMLWFYDLKDWKINLTAMATCDPATYEWEAKFAYLPSLRWYADIL